MRLRDLKPEFQQRYAKFTPETGGTDPLPEVQMTFRCPKCGGHRSVQLYLSSVKEDDSRKVWYANPLPGTALDWLDRITVRPSVQLPVKAHGDHAPDCGAHFSIINGEITP